MAQAKNLFKTWQFSQNFGIISQFLKKNTEVYFYYIAFLTEGFDQYYDTTKVLPPSMYGYKHLSIGWSLSCAVMHYICVWEFVQIKSANKSDDKN